MEINNDLNLLVSFAIAYIAENCELSDESFSKLQGLSQSIEGYLLSNLGNNDTPSQVIDDLIKNIESIQEKIDAYDDLEYSKGDIQ